MIQLTILISFYTCPCQDAVPIGRHLFQRGDGALKSPLCLIQLIRILTLQTLRIFIKMNVLDALLVLFQRFSLNYLGRPCLMEYGDRPIEIEKMCESYGGFLPTYREMIGDNFLERFFTDFSQLGEIWLIIRSGLGKLAIE